MPRVLHGCDFFLKYTAALAAGMSRNGVDAMLLTRSHDFEFGNVSGAMLRSVADQTGGAFPHLTLPGRARDLSPVAVRELRAQVRRFRPDVVHLQDSVASDPRLLVVAGARPRRYALTLHDPVPHPGDATPSGWKRRLRSALVRSAALVFVHAESLAAETRRIHSPRGPVVVVPHGAGPATAQPLPASPSLLFFGRVSHYKGLDVLLDAMPSVWAAMPDVGLTVAGHGHYPAHPLLDDGRVTVRRGYVPDSDVPGLFGAASLVVLPYRQASQSGVGSEARQHGRPLIVTEAGGLPELVTPETGRVVPPETPTALAASVLELLSDRERLERMAAAAAAASGEVADWDRVAALTVVAYQRHLT